MSFRLVLLIKKLARPVGAWLGFSGLYALTAGTCPFCGQTSCPGGAVTAGIAGALLAAGLSLWKRLAAPPPETLEFNTTKPNTTKPNTTKPNTTEHKETSR